MLEGLIFLVASYFGMETLDQILPPDAPIIYTLPNGTLVEEKPGEQCPNYSSLAGCAIRDSNGKYTIYYPYGGAGHHVRQHELGHAKGGEHDEWEPRGSDLCAKVTKSGDSGWKVGEYECTVPETSITEFPNPMK